MVLSEFLEILLKNAVAKWSLRLRHIWIKSPRFPVTEILNMLYCITSLLFAVSVGICVECLDDLLLLEGRAMCVAMQVGYGRSTWPLRASRIDVG